MILVMAAMISKVHAQDTPDTRAAEEIILAVTVNTVVKGDFFALRTLDGDILLRAEDITRLGIKDPGKYVDVRGEKYVSLRSLQPQSSFEVDLRELKLDLRASPELLPQTVLDLYQVPTKAAPAKDTAFFLNYTASYDATKEAFGSGSFNLPTEMGVRYRNLLFLNTTLFERNRSQRNFVRLNTSASHDDTVSLRRTVLGDFDAASGPLGSTSLLGGARITKNFSIDPYLQRYPVPSFEGVAQTPSQIEIYQQGRLLRSERVPPGKFTLENLPGATAGLGEYNIILKDAFGRELSFPRPYYLSNIFLKEGVHDYSYSLGFVRKEFGRESFEYGDPAFLAFHNVGFSDSLNAGFATEGSKDIFQIGPTAAFRLGTFGIANFAAAYSHAQGHDGVGGILAHEFSTRRFSTKLFTRLFSRDYVNLSLVAATQRTFLESGLSLSLNLEPLGFVSGEVVTTKRHVGQDLDRFSFSYNRRLPGGLTLFVSHSTTRTNRTAHSLFVGLNYVIGKGISANLNHTTNDNEHRENLTVLKSAPDGEGLGYRFALDRTLPEEERPRTEGNAFLQYNGRLGTYTSEYRRSLEQDNFTFALSGSVAGVGTSVHLSRPIHDSFALVRVPGVKGVGVKFNNRAQGSTDRNGEVLIPNILSFHANQLEIEPQDIPLNFSFDATTKRVTPLFRSGALVEFELRKIQAIFGTLAYTEAGEERHLEYGTLEILGPGDKVVPTPIGKEGEFYLENLPPGKYRGKAVSKAKTCSVEIVVPRQDDLMIDLGKLICESTQ